MPPFDSAFQFLQGNQPVWIGLVTTASSQQFGSVGSVDQDADKKNIDDTLKYGGPREMRLRVGCGEHRILAMASQTPPSAPLINTWQPADFIRDSSTADEQLARVREADP